MFINFSPRRDTSTDQRLNEVENALTNLTLCGESSSAVNKDAFSELRRKTELAQQNVLSSIKELKADILQDRKDFEERGNKMLEDHFVSKVFLTQEINSILFTILRWGAVTAVSAVASSFALIKYFA